MENPRAPLPLVSPVEVFTLGDEALSQLVRDLLPNGHGTRLLTAEKNGTLHAFNLTTKTDHTTQPSFTGFINTGPSIDDQHAYFGFRWKNSATSSFAGSATGALVAVNKDTWQVEWERDTPLLGGSHDRSWINVTPIIWQSGQSADRRIIVGDAGGGITAFAPTGDPGRLFLTSGHQPLDCDTVEAKDPTYHPAFTYSSQALLTRYPYKRDGENAWHNTQGVATEMSIYKGRLFTGYNHAEPAKSSLVIFRPAANIAMGELHVERLTGTAPVPLKPSDTLNKGDKVRVSVPVTYQADPLNPLLHIPVVVGFAGATPVERTEPFAPFETRVLTFELTVPAGQTDLVLQAAANPALYVARRDYEATRELPPGVTAAPAPLPDGWSSGGAVATGEVWALDNARSVSMPRTSRNDCYIVSFNVPLIPVYLDNFPFEVWLHFVAPEGARADGTLNVTLLSDDSEISVPLSAPVTLTAFDQPKTITGHFDDLPPGTYNLAAEILCPVDTNPANNRKEATVRVLKPGKVELPEKGSALTD